jgi:hypothetical protein
VQTEKQKQVVVAAAVVVVEVEDPRQNEIEKPEAVAAVAMELMTWEVHLD